MPVFMKIEGIDGEVTASGHEKWIMIESVGWATGVAGRSGGAAGKATFKEFTITKKTDTASASLSRIAGGRGSTVRSLRVHYATLAGDGSVMPQARVELENVLITSYSIAGHGLEKFSLNFTAPKATEDRLTQIAHLKQIETISG